MPSAALPVVVHVGCSPSVAAVTGVPNEFQIFHNGASGVATTFTADRAIAGSILAGDALAKTMSSIPRYSSLLVVLMGENGDETVIDTCIGLEKVVAEPSTLTVHYLANDGSGTLSETLYYEDCVALARERAANKNGSGRLAGNRFAGVSSFNVLLDDRSISVIVCTKLSSPILAALECSPRRELWVVITDESDTAKLTSLFTEMPGISELVSQISPPPAPTIETFLEAAVSSKSELDRLRRLLESSRSSMNPEQKASSDLQEEVEVLEKENHQLSALVNKLRQDHEEKIAQHSLTLDKFESENARLRQQLRDAQQQLQQQQRETQQHAAAVGASRKTSEEGAEAVAIANASRARNAVLQEELTVTTQALEQSLRHCDEYKLRIDVLEERARELEASKRQAELVAENRTRDAAQQADHLRAAHADQRRENLLLVNEFQQKEKRWQTELLEASDALNRALANYHQARTVVEMQSRTLEAAAASAMATQQLQNEELDHLVHQVRALSPQRRNLRHRAHEGLLLSPPPADGGLTIRVSENGVGPRSGSMQTAGSSLAHYADRTSSVEHGRERVLDI